MNQVRFKCLMYINLFDLHDNLRGEYYYLHSKGKHTELQNYSYITQNHNADMR